MRMKKQANSFAITTRKKDAARFRKELSLLKTLAVTVLMFVICWLPYGIVVLFFSGTVPPRVKKVRQQMSCCGKFDEKKKKTWTPRIASLREHPG